MPLTKEQPQKLSEFKLGANRTMFLSFFTLFDEKQSETLKAVYGSNPGLPVAQNARDGSFSQ